MKYLELREVQIEELNILKRTMTFLDNNNIKYYLAAGSLLGAVRHKGFIPWDDDIDVYIPRPDFEKIVEIARKKPFIDEEKKHKIIYCQLNTSFQPFIKIINEDIVIDEVAELDTNLWIDIFPMDGVPESEEERKKVFKDNYIKHWDLILKSLKFRNVFKIIPDKKLATKRFLRKFLLVFKEKKKLEENYINGLKKYDFNSCKYIANAAWTNATPYALDKESFLEQALYEFEDIKITSFKDYDTYLRMEYGDDYMTPPPEKDRKSHLFKAYLKKDKLAE